MNAETPTRLLTLLRSRALKLGDFTLASGQKSNYYFDSKKIQLHSEGAHLLGEALYDLLKDETFDAIGGKAVGAVPLVTAFAVCCHLHGKEVEGFFVRDKVKDHGTSQQVEGVLNPGDKAVIVEDVCTTGGSLLQAVHAAEAHGAEVTLVVSVVDRLQGGSDKVRELGYRYKAIFTKDDLLEGMDV